MGENKHIEEIDAFAKKYIKEIPVESPSTNFTANLMGTISQLQTERKIEYKPLISKKGWFVVIAAVIAIIVMPFKNSEEGLFTLPELNLSFIEKLNFSGVFESVSISTPILYLVILFSVLIFIQIFYLKGYFEKQING